jgi:hypothetical protein
MRGASWSCHPVASKHIEIYYLSVHRTMMGPGNRTMMGLSKPFEDASARFLYSTDVLSFLGWIRCALSNHGILYPELKSHRERYATNILTIKG